MSFFGNQQVQTSDFALANLNYGVGKTFYVYNNALDNETDESDGNAFIGGNPASSTRGPAGSDSNPGTLRSPLRSLQGAIDKCIYGRGDTIVFLPGHKEYIENGVGTAVVLLMSKADVTVVGVGTGRRRPTLYMGRGISPALGTPGTVSNGTTISITAPGVRFENIQFAGGGVVALTTFITGSNAAATDCVFKNCVFDQSPTTAGGVGQVQAAATLGANAKRWVFEDCTFLCSASTPLAVSLGTSTPGNISFLNNRFYGFYTTAIINGTGAATEILIRGNSMTNRSTTAGDKVVIFSSATSSGVCEFNSANSKDSAVGASGLGFTFGGTLWFAAENYGGVGSASTSGTVQPLLAT